MSEGKGNCPNGLPQPEQCQPSASATDKGKNQSTFCLQNSMLDPVTHSSNSQKEDEKDLNQAEGLTLHSNGADGQKTLIDGEPLQAITSQPQTRSPPLSFSNSTDHSPLLKSNNNPAPNVHNMKSGTDDGISSSNLISIGNSQKPLRKLQPHPSVNSQRSKASSKSSSSQIPKEVQQDCCVHCILACLFCKFLMLCNIVVDCITCGSCTSDESCLCCCCCPGECADCDLPCDLDCGIMDACCESADCLEICMECCGLCFSS
uniref:MyoD family inhibitor n=1 Tax=Geotrypetes seraphini TaxID=260995 RepID=A0A6P8PDM8_GEOSA|nr:myoD family inhibitor [Geotrypetes seraphini]